MNHFNTPFQPFILDICKLTKVIAAFTESQKDTKLNSNAK